MNDHEHDHHAIPDSPERFDAMAATWDERPGAREQAARVAVAIREGVPLHTGMEVLEIGGGTGLLSRALAADIDTALVTDVSPGMVSAATQVLSDDHPGWAAQLWDVERDPLPDKQFDLVVSQLALHHMGDIPAVLGRVWTLLRPGGYVALADLERDEDGGFHRHVVDFHGHHGFSRERLVEWLTAAGFADVAVREAGHITKEVEGASREFPLLLAVGRRP